MVRARVACVLCATLLAAASARADAVRVYWGGDDGIVRRANPDGSGAEDVFDAGSAIQGMEIDSLGGKVYWTTTQQSWNVLRADVADGANIEPIGGAFNGNQMALALDVANAHAYYTAPGFSRRINRVDFPGGNDIQIVGAFDAMPLVIPTGLDLRLQTGQIYWGDPNVSGVRTADLDGSNIQTLLVTGTTLRALAIDEVAGFMYWSTTSTGSIFRASLDGSGSTTLVSGLPAAPWEIEIDRAAGKLYWALASPASIQRADLDGTNVETIVNTIGSPKALALLYAPSVPAMDGVATAIALCGLLVAAGVATLRLRVV